MNDASNRFRCHCGRFLKEVRAVTNFEQEIKSVSGICAKHGTVPVKAWDWEDFFPEPATTPEKTE